MRGSEGVVDELSGFIKKCLLSGGGLARSADGLQLRPHPVHEKPLR